MGHADALVYPAEVVICEVERQRGLPVRLLQVPRGYQFGIPLDPEAAVGPASESVILFRSRVPGLQRMYGQNSSARTP
jgi:hypothetical protein